MRDEAIWRDLNSSVQAWGAFPYLNNRKNPCVSRYVDVAGVGSVWWSTAVPISRQHCHQLGWPEEVAWGGLAPFILMVPPSQAIPPWHGTLRWTNTRASAQGPGLGTAAADKQPARRNGDLLQCVLKWAAGISSYGNWSCHWKNTSNRSLCKPWWIEELSADPDLHL